MPNLREYWQGIAKKAGLTDDEAKAVEEFLGNDKVAKVFENGFVMRPDYSRDLDKQRDKLSGELDEVKGKNQKLVEWWEKEAQPAYQANLQGVESLKRYVELYGDLPDDNGKPVGKPNPDTLTQKQLDEALAVQGQNMVNLTKMAMRIGSDYLHRFKEPMSEEELAKLEKLAVDSQIPLDKAYDMYIAPRVREQEVEALTAKHEKDKADAVRDALSKHNLPVDPKPPEFHPFFNRPDAPGPKDALEARQHSKAEFMRGLQEDTGAG